jgi:hypothetical protein
MNVEHEADAAALPANLRRKYCEYATLKEHYKRSRQERVRRQRDAAMAKGLEVPPLASCVVVTVMTTIFLFLSWYLYVPDWVQQNEMMQRRAHQTFTDLHTYCAHPNSILYGACTQAEEVLRRDPWNASEWPHLKKD